MPWNQIITAAVAVVTIIAETLITKK